MVHLRSHLPMAQKLKRKKAQLFAGAVSALTSHFVMEGTRKKVGKDSKVAYGKASNLKKFGPKVKSKKAIGIPIAFFMLLKTLFLNIPKGRVRN